ncbi:MAG: Replicative DNA helicase [Anaerolineales bacterium]|nr:Replicative DNA helicase [Anaerolineales bacterium]
MDMIQQQIERRRKRGKGELKRIVNKGHHPIYSTFEITSVSGRTYRVRIHDLEELHNTCTCPDYQTNLIGTCKHIEGVLIQLRDKYDDDLEELAAEKPDFTRIYLHYARDVTVRVSQPLPESPELRKLLNRYFDAEGILQGPVLHTLPALLHELDNLPAQQRSALDVGDRVRDHLELLRDREAIRKQKEWFAEQVREGNRSLNVLNTRLYPFQEEGAMHLAFGRRAMLADDMGLGKCVGPDTPIFLNGTLVRAEDIWDHYAGIVTPDNEGEWAEPAELLWTNALSFGQDTEQMVPARVVRLYRQRISEPVRLIRLDDGSEIMITKRHKLLGRFGWENQLQPGDYVCVPARLDWDGPEADPDLVKLLAWQIAGGYELPSRGTVRITQKNVSRLEALRETARRVGEKFSIPMYSLKIYRWEDKTPCLNLNSRPYRRFLEGRGYTWGELSAGKQIPDFIIGGGLETARLFLREYFTAEGSAVESMHSVEITSASEWLMQQLSCMLRRFGIWLRISAKQKRATNADGPARTYYVGTLGGNAARIFLDEIGFSDGEKQRKLEAICALPSNTNVEGIPAADLLQEMAESTGLPMRHPGVGTVYFTGTQNLSQQSANQVVNAVDSILSGEAEEGYRQLPPSKWTERTLAAYTALDHEALRSTQAQLIDLTEREVFYSRIVEIQEIDYDGWVYDFEVENHHNFVAANVLCHNTVQAIAAAVLLRQLRDIQCVLVICPASLKHQWAREVRRFTDLEAQVIEGPPDKRPELYANPAFFNMINYELVLRDVDQIQRMQPDVIILDEAQRIKNWRTKTADTVKRLESPYAFVLTGTPLENRLDELYSIFQFLNPRILGPLWKFNERYFQVEPKGKSSYKVLGYKNLDELRTRIGPYVLRRVRDEVLDDLPARTDNNFFVEMTDPQWKHYEEYQATVARLISQAKRRPLTPKERNVLLGSLVKMRVICNALALHLKDLDPKDHERTAPKLRELRHILTDEVSENGHKALVFSQWTGMLELTEPMLQRIGLGYEKLSGDVPTSKRSELIERFFEDDDCRVFLSTDAGGTGLNLQAASLVINLDLPWNPAVLEQRIARAHRHGQPRGVQVVNLIAQKTIEERMLDTLQAKRDVFQGVFGGEGSPAAISFRDTGQELLKSLDEMLDEPKEVETEIELEPTEEGPAVAPARPTLDTFADLVVARFPGRVLLVRKAPQVPGAVDGQGVLVVVDEEPATLRPKVESLLDEHWADSPPALHLMEREGYRALAALMGGALPAVEPEAEPYRAPALPKKDPREAERKRLRKADEGFGQADKRLKLAAVVLNGGFPEEAARPIREALGWGLTAFLTLVKDREPAADLPAPREVQAALVDADHLPVDLAARLSHVRELTAPPEEDEEPVPLSESAAETLIAGVRDLIDLGRQRVVEAGL